MNHLLLLDVPEPLMAALEARAAAAGMSCEAWLTTRLADLAEEPVVWLAYSFQAWSATGATLHLARGSGSGEVLLEQQHLGIREQVIAQAAKALMSRNHPGDREIARTLLKQHFDVVVETTEPFIQHQGDRHHEEYRI